MFPVSPLECKFLQEINEVGFSLRIKEATEIENPKFTNKAICILHYAHAAQPTQLRRYRASEPICAQIQDPEVPQRAQLFRDCAKEQVVIQIPTRKRRNSGKQSS
jgi:hypothetical protein